jgi:hypothetical protein
MRLMTIRAARALLSVALLLAGHAYAGTLRVTILRDVQKDFVTLPSGTVIDLPEELARALSISRYADITPNATGATPVSPASGSVPADGTVTNSILANMATKTYKGRTAAGTGAPTDVPVATLKADLSLDNVDNTSDATKNAATVTLTNKTLTAPTINGGTHTGVTGLGIRSSGTGAFDLTLANSENLTAGRTLTLTVNDAARTIDLGGNITVAGAFATSGANSLTLTTTAGTNVTLPTSGTLATTGQALAETLCVAASDETTALTAGTSKVTWRMPFAMTLTSVRASVNTAQASGTILTVDLNEGGTTVLSTKLSIDNNEKTSTTAATPAVISDTALADDAEMTIDIDAVDGATAAKGLKVCLIGSR